MLAVLKPNVRIVEYEIAIFADDAVKGLVPPYVNFKDIVNGTRTFPAPGAGTSVIGVVTKF